MAVHKWYRILDFGLLSLSTDTIDTLPKYAQIWSECLDKQKEIEMVSLYGGTGSFTSHACNKTLGIC